MANFFSRLSYSFGMEDPAAEWDALKLGPKDTALCITGSGDRPLHLLKEGPEKVIALDVNPIQNHLLQLKVAAMRSLEYDEYLAFLGLTPHPHRRSVLARLEMPLLATTFWNRHTHWVDKGVIYQGVIERTCQWGAQCLKPFLGRQIDTLFSFTDLHAQNMFLSTVWNPKPLRRVLSYFLHPTFTRHVIGDPALYTFFQPDLNVGSHVYDRIMNLLSHTLARHSPLLSFFLKGTVPKEAYPSYLTLQGYHKIKPHLDRLQIVTEPLDAFLSQSEEESFDAYSLSDVASYMSEGDFHALCSALYRTAKPKARYCIRQFLSTHALPENIPFERNTPLEEKWKRYEKCFVYTFFIGSV